MSFIFEETETKAHLLIQRAFAKQVTNIVCSWFDFAGAPDDVAVQTVGVTAWLQVAGAAMEKRRRRRLTTGVLLYTWWNAWKERNRRIFQGTEKECLHVALLTKEEINCYHLAWRNGAVEQTAS